MDILKPHIVWVENRCYRKLPIKGDSQVADPYREEDLYPAQPNEQDEEDEYECNNLPILHEGDHFWISIHIPGPLIGLVKGKMCKNIKTIQQTTYTEITIPKSGKSYKDDPNRSYQFIDSEQGVDAVITGKKRISVYDAYRRIESIINNGRWKVGDYTHFISIPMNIDEIKSGFLKFKEDVLISFKTTRGMSPALFQFPEKLHLTIVIMTLLNDREKQRAQAELNKCKRDILRMLGGKELKVKVQGIEYMNDDPADVDILYGKIRETDGDNSLQLIADQLADAFVQINLAKKEYDSVKLHLTLMKSRSGDKGQRQSFDARPILKKYENYLFGEMTIKEIHISARFTGNENKYYTSTASVTL